MKKNRSTYVLVFTIFFFIIYAVYAYDLPKWFPFNEHNALKEWQEKVFKDKVIYVVKSQTKEGYLLAKSTQACSGLLYPIKFDVKKTPMMSWQWKVAKFPAKKKKDASPIGWIERDDYAARVYVIFSSWNFLNTKSLEYVWDESLPQGTLMTSPYLANIKLLVVESGKKQNDDWVFEKRNIYEDYKKAFGKAPPRYVSAIALMTDADNTLSSAEAQYKDLKVGFKQLDYAQK